MLTQQVHSGLTMKTQIDFKSAVGGLVAGVLLAFTLGASSVEPNAVGRYQISVSDHRSQIIDTKTGKVWQAYYGNAPGITDNSFYAPKLEAQ